MALKLKVSNIACEGCAEILTKSIHVMERKTKMDIDVNAKTVTVESAASEESIKQVIVTAGYAVKGYCSGSSFSQKLRFSYFRYANKIFYIFSALSTGGIKVIFPTLGAGFNINSFIWLCFLDL